MFNVALSLVLLDNRDVVVGNDDEMMALDDAVVWGVAADEASQTLIVVFCLLSNRLNLSNFKESITHQV